MAFAFTDEHIEQHARDGFAVFRQILPPSLVLDWMAAVTEAAERRKLAGISWMNPYEEPAAG